MNDLISTTGFIYLEVPKGTSRIIECDKNLCHYLFFLLSGPAQLCYEDKLVYMPARTVYFRSLTDEYQITAFDSDVKILINYLTQPCDLREKLRLKNLHLYLDSDMATNQSLEINSGFQRFLTDFIVMMPENRNNESFLDTKQQELYTLLRLYYSKPQLAVLFAPIVCYDLFEYAFQYVTHSKNQSI
jgi:hypothetical protein